MVIPASQSSEQAATVYVSRESEIPRVFPVKPGLEGISAPKDAEMHHRLCIVTLHFPQPFKMN